MSSNVSRVSSPWQAIEEQRHRKRKPWLLSPCRVCRLPLHPRPRRRNLSWRQLFLPYFWLLHDRLIPTVSRNLYELLLSRNDFRNFESYYWFLEMTTIFVYENQSVWLALNTVKPHKFIRLQALHLSLVPGPVKSSPSHRKVGACIGQQNLLSFPGKPRRTLPSFCSTDRSLCKGCFIQISIQFECNQHSILELLFRHLEKKQKTTSLPNDGFYGGKITNILNKPRVFTESWPTSRLTSHQCVGASSCARKRGLLSPSDSTCRISLVLSEHRWIKTHGVFSSNHRVIAWIKFFYLTSWEQRWETKGDYVF